MIGLGDIHQATYLAVLPYPTLKSDGPGQHAVQCGGTSLHRVTKQSLHNWTKPEIINICEAVFTTGELIYEFASEQHAVQRGGTSPHQRASHRHTRAKPPSYGGTCWVSRAYERR